MKPFRLFRRTFCLFPLLFLAFSFQASASQNAPSAPCKRIEIPAPSLAGNQTGEATRQPLYVYLPPSYEEGHRRYPVIYFFAGYYESCDISYLADGVADAMRRSEFILVSVNDINSLHGSFGAASPVTGDWCSFFLKDAIPYIDSHFRTIAAPEGRLAGGFSMGGHIALRLAFEHSEVFSALYAVSPGVFDEHGLEAAMPTWDEDFLKAYGAAYSPNPKKPYPHAEWPLMDGSAEDMAIRTRWNKGFGNLPELLASYLDQPLRLKAIAIEVGAKDDYPWIPDGCFYFDGLLSRSGVPHRFILTEHRHEFDARIFAEGMGVFAAEYFNRAGAEGN